MDISLILGFIGTAIVIIAYLPQVTHLIKEHCSAGISLKAYLLWLVASALLFIRAIMIGDMVFITLQVFNLLLIGIIISYTYKYRTRACQSHVLSKNGDSKNPYQTKKHY